MADNRSGGGTGMALLIGGLIVAVGFLIYFIFGDDFATTTAPDGVGTTVNVETNAGGGAGEGGATSDGATTGESTDSSATGGSTDGSTTDSGTSDGGATGGSTDGASDSGSSEGTTTNQ